MTNPGTILQFGETLIGQKGGIDPVTLPAIGNVAEGMSEAILQGRGSVNANVQLGAQVSVNPNISLTVINSSGLNSAVLETVNANLNAETINSRMND